MGKPFLYELLITIQRPKYDFLCIHRSFSTVYDDETSLLKSLQMQFSSITNCYFITLKDISLNIRKYWKYQECRIPKDHNIQEAYDGAPPSMWDDAAFRLQNNPPLSKITYPEISRTLRENFTSYTMRATPSQESNIFRLDSGRRVES